MTDLMFAAYTLEAAEHKRNAALANVQVAKARLEAAREEYRVCCEAEKHAIRILYDARGRYDEAKKNADAERSADRD